MHNIKRNCITWHFRSITKRLITIVLLGINKSSSMNILVYCVIMIILFHAIFKTKSIILYTLESSIEVNYRFSKAPFISNKIFHERWKDDLRGSFEIMLAWPSISDNFPFKYWSGCYYFLSFLDRKRLKINRMFEEDDAF